MKASIFQVGAMVLICISLAACQKESVGQNKLPTPIRIVDLGALVGNDLPRSLWGEYSVPFPDEGPITVQDVITTTPYYIAESFHTLFNHFGPHVDAPNHMDATGKSIDDFAPAQFTGPLKLLDVSHLRQGSIIQRSAFDGLSIEPGDIVLVFTGYRPTESENEPNVYSALSDDAAEYLASLRIHGFGTDGLSVERTGANRVSSSVEGGYRKQAPIHYAFLTRDILIYEQLMNLGALVQETNLYFIGIPLNIDSANGAPVRPIVLVY